MLVIQHSTQPIVVQCQTSGKTRMVHVDAKHPWPFWLKHSQHSKATLHGSEAWLVKNWSSGLVLLFAPLARPWPLLSRLQRLSRPS